MDNRNQENIAYASEVILTEQTIKSQKLTIERLAASKLDVTWAEMNLREMKDHLNSVQKRHNTTELATDACSA